MHRKVIFALFLALILILGLAACGEQKSDETLRHSFIAQGKVHAFATNEADKVAYFNELWERLLARDESLEGVTFLDEFPGVNCKANLEIDSNRMSFYFEDFTFDGVDYEDKIFVSVRPDNVDTQRAVIEEDSELAREILELMEYLKTEGEDVSKD